MPYDPRKVSEGGNQGIDEIFTRAPEVKKFRVIGVDTFDGTDWVEGEFTTLKEAQDHANARGGTMLKMYVYDTDGRCVGSGGSW